ncbi:prepilin peptidase [Macrococcoides caseolyticum]|uniref:prepilin peptidase n=1 Tax=Macrococcoides caseolyticum TaxID=69966 RepID=UPI001F2747CB|nr:prepilin peptidase [Macrococcus caseolyticus]
MNPILDCSILILIAIFIIPIAIYDLETLMIQNKLLILLMMLLIILTTIEMDVTHGHFDYSMISYKILIFILLHLFYFLTQSIGYGDIKLFSILLIFLPIPFFIALFFVTYLIGGLACIIFLSYKTELKKIPLVPIIASAYFVVIILYEPIKKLYFGGFVT